MSEICGTADKGRATATPGQVSDVSKRAQLFACSANLAGSDLWERQGKNDELFSLENLLMNFYRLQLNITLINRFTIVSIECKQL